MRAFSIFVLPILEYCSPIWSPHTSKNITILESVQRRFTKRLPGMFYLTYEDRLLRLGIESLEKRRIKNDLLLAYKIIFGIVKTNLKLELHPFTKTRCHDYKLKVPTSNSDMHKYFFTSRVTKLWNSLPKETDFSSLQNFRLSLDSIDLNRYCKIN